MAGTKLGGLKAAATNKERFGDDFYSVIGREGGRKGHTGGFAANHTMAVLAGAKGGRMGKRGKTHTLRKVKRNGKEVLQIFVYRKNTPTQKVRVNYGNN